MRAQDVSSEAERPNVEMSTSTSVNMQHQREGTPFTTYHRALFQVILTAWKNKM